MDRDQPLSSHLDMVDIKESIRSKPSFPPLGSSAFSDLFSTLNIFLSIFFLSYSLTFAKPLIIAFAHWVCLTLQEAKVVFLAWDCCLQVWASLNSTEENLKHGERARGKRRGSCKGFASKFPEDG